MLKNDNYKVDADEIIMGKNVIIEESVLIAGIGDRRCRKVKIGDNTFLGKDTLILAPEFEIGDYGTIHRRSRISGYKSCRIGHNFWMDQNCILNCTDDMVIGNNVGIGAYSQLWTHIKFGDMLEGCRFNSTKTMNIEDDVWFVGHCMVSPIHAKSKSMALLGSVIIKDMEKNHIYGGCPAIDLTPKLGPPYKNRNIEEKYEEMERKRVEFGHKMKLDIDRIRIIKEFPRNCSEEITYFNVKTREYLKRGSKVEIEFIKFLLPLYKFIPKANCL